MIYLSVMICVNNPHNGLFCGRIAGLEISDFLHLEPRVLPEPRCTLRGGYFSVHRHKVPIFSHQSWVGNWCWDAVSMKGLGGAALIAHLLSQHVSDEAFKVWGFDRADGEAAIELMQTHVAPTGSEAA